MSKNEKAENNGKNHLDEDLITDIDAEVEKELPQAQPGLRHHRRAGEPGYWPLFALPRLAHPATA